MPGKPRKNKQISIDYKTHQKLETEAIENDKTIKEVAEEYIYNDNEEEINKLRNRIERLKDKAEHFKTDRNTAERENEKLKKRVEKLEKKGGSTKEYSGWEEATRENLVESLKLLEGIGEHTAKQIADAFEKSDTVKVLGKKENE